MSSLVDTSLDSSTSQGQQIMQIETQIWVSLISLIALGHIKKYMSQGSCPLILYFHGYLRKIISKSDDQN